MELSVLINEYGYFWHMLNERDNIKIHDFMNAAGDDIVSEMMEQVGKRGRLAYGTYIFNIADAIVEDCWIDADLDGRPVYGRWLKWGEITVEAQP